MGEDYVEIAMIYDDSARRFASLDSNKYGKISLISSEQGYLAYPQGLTINGRELIFPDDSKSHLNSMNKSIDYFPQCLKSHNASVSWIDMVFWARTKSSEEWKMHQLSIARQLRKVILTNDIIN